MLLRRRRLAFALVCPVVEFTSGVPKPKNPTDSGGEEDFCGASLELTEGEGAKDRSGRETLTVVPRPLLLRTKTVPPSDFTVWPTRFNPWMEDVSFSLMFKPMMQHSQGRCPVSNCSPAGTV
jgi:hypothetical protein